MKKNYLKSIGLILLGAIVSSFVSSYSLEKPISSDQDHRVILSTAQQDIAAFQMWQNSFPDSISIDTSDIYNVRIDYKPKTISFNDWAILETYIKPFLEKNKHYSYSNLPFYSRLNTSYYISRSNIEEAFDAFDEATGINVYLGTRGLDNLKLDSLESHLYVVPTKSEGSILEDKLIDGEYALDLTHPCPALCAIRSKLFYPRLNAYSQKNNDSIILD